jgi:hypothetical protein
VKFPLVSRKAHDQAKKDVDGLATELARVHELHRNTLGTLGQMTAHAKSMEAKLRDLGEPPISTEDLRALLKRHSFIQAKCEALEKRCAELEAKVNMPEPMAVTQVGPPSNHVQVVAAPKNTGVM